MGEEPASTPSSSANLEELINLELLPNWAREPARTASEFEHHVEDRPRREPGRGPRAGPGRRDDFGGGARRENRRDFSQGDRRDRPPRGAGRPDRGGSSRFAPRDPIPVTPPPGIDLAILPESRAVEAVAAQVKTSGRAYPLFALGRMFVAKPERHRIRFRTLGKEGEASSLLQCVTCGTVARTATDLARHVLERHLADHYREEKTTEEPPKGNFAAVARCSLNGALLGPTNHHSYQAALLKLHRSRFPSMSIERFKASIVLDRTPAVVEQWRQQVSTRAIFVPLHGENPKPLASESEVERHFREHRLAEATRSGKEFSVDGLTGRDCADAGLRTAVRAMVAEESLFPRRLIGILAETLSKVGLAIFRGPRGMLFVATTRPTPFAADPSHVAPGVCAILDFVQEHPRKGRKDLIRALCPSATTPHSAPAAEGTPAPVPDPKLVACLGDLEWLIRQGHIIEYFNGELEHVAPKPAAAGGDPTPPLPRPKNPRRRHPRGSAQNPTASGTKTEKTSVNVTATAPETPVPTETPAPASEPPPPEPLTESPPNADGQPPRNP